MKHSLLLLAFIFGASTAGKPGSCPTVTSESDGVTSGPSQCTIDINCPGSNKCCNGMCVMPVCEDGVEAMQCDVDPCAESSCSGYRRAKCFPDACNNCAAIWLSRLSLDVTDTCDDPSRKSRLEKKKAKWIKKRCAKLIKRGKGRLPNKCQNQLEEAETADDFEEMQTMGWETKREQWKKKFMKAKGNKKAMKKKRKERRKLMKVKKRERKQEHLASMTAKRQAMIERLEKKIAAKKGSKKTARWEKKLAKLEAKQATITETKTVAIE